MYVIVLIVKLCRLLIASIVGLFVNYWHLCYLKICVNLSEIESEVFYAFSGFSSDDIHKP